MNDFKTRTVNGTTQQSGGIGKNTGEIMTDLEKIEQFKNEIAAIYEKYGYQLKTEGSVHGAHEFLIITHLDKEKGIDVIKEVEPANFYCWRCSVHVPFYKSHDHKQQHLDKGDYYV